MSDIMKIDLYALLDITNDCSEQQIKKAYRKKALACHPDKHPDNPKAAELFRQLSKALEILTDVTAKAAYDRVLRARKSYASRDRHLDSKRRKLKEELEAKEKAARDEAFSEAEASAKLSAEIERLRKEGSKQLEVEKEILKKQIEEELRIKSQLIDRKNQNLPQLKIKRLSKSVEMSELNLRKHFTKFGEISGIVIAKNCKTAIIEFTTFESAVNALQSSSELFALQWVNPIENTSEVKPQMHTSVHTSSDDTPHCTLSDTDYESVVLRNLRHAEERKRLIKLMESEDVIDIS